MAAQRANLSSSSRSMAHALKTFYCRKALGTRVNPDIIGCVWTGEFDLNTLRVDAAIFEFGMEMLRIQKYPVTCGRGLIKKYIFFCLLIVLPFYFLAHPILSSLFTQARNQGGGGVCKGCIRTPPPHRSQRSAF